MVYERGDKKRKIIELTEQGYSITETAKLVGANERYVKKVRRLLKEAQANK